MGLAHIPPPRRLSGLPSPSIPIRSCRTLPEVARATVVVARVVMTSDMVIGKGWGFEELKELIKVVKKGSRRPKKKNAIIEGPHSSSDSLRPSPSLSSLLFSSLSLRCPSFLLPHLSHNGRRRRLPKRRLVARRRLARRPEALAERHRARRRRNGRRGVQGLLDVGEARDAPRRSGQADPVEEVVGRAGGTDRGRRGDEPGKVERGKREKSGGVAVVRSPPFSTSSVPSLPPL